MTELTPKELNEKINEILKEENLLGSILKTRESMDNLIESVIRNIALGTLELLRRLVKEIVDERLDELAPKKQDNGAKKGRKKKEEFHTFTHVPNVPSNPTNLQEVFEKNPSIETQEEALKALKVIGNTAMPTHPISISGVNASLPEEQKGIQLYATGETPILDLAYLPPIDDGTNVSTVHFINGVCAIGPSCPECGEKTQEQKPEDTPIQFASTLEDHIIRSVCACYGSPEQFMNMHVRKKEGIPLTHIHTWLKETYPGKYDSISMIDLRQQILKDCPSFKEVSSFAFHSDLFEKIMNGA